MFYKAKYLLVQIGKTVGKQLCSCTRSSFSLNLLSLTDWALSQLICERWYSDYLCRQMCVELLTTQSVFLPLHYKSPDLLLQLFCGPRWYAHGKCSKWEISLSRIRSREPRPSRKEEALVAWQVPTYIYLRWERVTCAGSLGLYTTTTKITRNT